MMHGFKHAASYQQGHSGDAGPSTPQKQCIPQASQSHSASQSDTTSRSMSKTAKQEHRYGSVDYWKCMYKQSQATIHQSYEKNLKLREIPGLLRVKKELPKEVNKNKNTRITNVHGSTEGQDILKLVESAEKEKKNKRKKKEKKVQQKRP